MPFFGSMPFGGQQFVNPQQSAQAALAPAQVVANALMGPLERQQMFAQQGGVRSMDDARAIAARGAADATLSNIGQSLNLGMGLMGGMGALKTAAKLGLSQFGIGENPFKDLAGFAKPSQQQLGSIQQGTPQQMQNQARRVAERAYAEAKAKRDAARATGMSNSASRGHAGGNYGGGANSSGASSRESRGV